MNKVLFVDDEPNNLSSIKRALRSKKDIWDMHFANSGAEAIEMLASIPFDIIVSDVRMPEMDGVELMHYVVEHYPHMVRIIISGYSDQELVIKSTSLVHQFLPKPCDTSLLISAIENGNDFFQLMEQQDLKALINKLQSIPSLPNLYFELMAAASAADSSANTIASIVGKDIGMSAKLLHIANSAVFGHAGQISTTNNAVIFLGFDIIKALTLSVHVFSFFEPTCLPNFDLQQIWRQSMATAGIGKRIAEFEKFPKDAVDKVFMAGLMHDIGRLLLASNLTEQYREVLRLEQEEGLNICDAEQKIFNVTHAEVGAYLLGLWGFPRDTVFATAMHHRGISSCASKFDIAACLYAANLISSLSTTNSEAIVLNPEQTEYFSNLGVADHFDDWVALVTAPDTDEDS